MQNLSLWVATVSAVLRVVAATSLDNHAVKSENLKDNINYDAFSIVETWHYKIQNGVEPVYNEYVQGTYRYYGYVCVFPSKTTMMAYSLYFGNRTATSVSMSMAADYPSGSTTVIRVYMDSLSSSPVSTLALNSTGSVTSFVTISTAVTTAQQGLHDVYFTLTSNAFGYPMYFNWFQFK